MPAPTCQISLSGSKAKARLLVCSLHSRTHHSLNSALTHTPAHPLSPIATICGRPVISPRSTLHPHSAPPLCCPPSGCSKRYTSRSRNMRPPCSHLDCLCHIPHLSTFSVPHLVLLFESHPRRPLPCPCAAETYPHFECSPPCGSLTRPPLTSRLLTLAGSGRS